MLWLKFFFATLFSFVPEHGSEFDTKEIKIKLSYQTNEKIEPQQEQMLGRKLSQNSAKRTSLGLKYISSETLFIWVCNSSDLWNETCKRNPGVVQQKVL